MYYINVTVNLTVCLRCCVFTHTNTQNRNQEQDNRNILYATKTDCTRFVLGSQSRPIPKRQKKWHLTWQHYTQCHIKPTQQDATHSLQQYTHIQKSWGLRQWGDTSCHCYTQTHNGRMIGWCVVQSWKTHWADLKELDKTTRLPRWSRAAAHTTVLFHFLHSTWTSRTESTSAAGCGTCAGWNTGIVAMRLSLI